MRLWRRALRRVVLEKLLEDGGPQQLVRWKADASSPVVNCAVWLSPVRCYMMRHWCLLDEPTEGLDATTESQILELLAEMMREKTVLMVTHRLRGLSFPTNNSDGQRANY